MPGLGASTRFFPLAERLRSKNACNTPAFSGRLGDGRSPWGCLQLYDADGGEFSRHGRSKNMTLRGRTLAREIATALAFKAIALILLYVAFFGPSHRIDASADRVASHVFGEGFVERGD